MTLRKELLIDPLALRAVFRFVTSLVARQSVEGRHRIPDPPYILAVNHLGLFDVPFVYGQLGGPHITAWAAEKWENHLLFGTLLKAGRAIFIQRGKVDRRAIKAAVDWLNEGNAFALAPEGTRSDNAALARGKTGVAYLADESNAPVVPVAITGTEAVGRQLLRLRPARLHCRIGHPVRLPPVSKDERMVDLRRNTDEIMCRLAALLPPSYRGSYADHPRTAELLAAGHGSPAHNDAID